MSTTEEHARQAVVAMVLGGAGDFGPYTTRAEEDRCTLYMNVYWYADATADRLRVWRTRLHYMDMEGYFATVLRQTIADVCMVEIPPLIDDPKQFDDLDIDAPIVLGTLGLAALRAHLDTLRTDTD